MKTENVKKIVLEGGPASGKSSVLKRLKQCKTSPNVNVVYLDEVATAFFHDQPAEIAHRDDPILRQFFILRTQLFAESMLLQNTDTSKPTILITDRGALDAFVYLTDAERTSFSSEHLDELWNRYDHVIYLEGNVNYYLNDNETRRLEVDEEDLLETERKSYSVWGQYKSFSYIKQQNTIEDKLNLVINDIHGFLGRAIYCRDNP